MMLYPPDRDEIGSRIPAGLPAWLWEVLPADPAAPMVGLGLAAEDPHGRHAPGAGAEERARAAVEECLARHPGTAARGVMHGPRGITWTCTPRRHGGYAWAREHAPDTLVFDTERGGEGEMTESKTMDSATLHEWRNGRAGEQVAAYLWEMYVSNGKPGAILPANRTLVRSTDRSLASISAGKNLLGKHGFLKKENRRWVVA